MSVLVAVVSDLHVNSVTGLCVPAFTLDNGGTYRASKGQLSLWSAWKEFWGVFSTVSASGDSCDSSESNDGPDNPKRIAVIAGDLNDLNVHSSAELISRSNADIIKMSHLVLEPMLSVVDEVFVVRGTEAHTGKRANLEEEVARDVGAVKDGSLSSWYWLRAEWGGVRFDVAHHPITFARRPWTIDAAASRHAYITRCEYVDRGERIPDVVLRGHVHKYIPSNNRLKPLFCYLPSWQMTTTFGYRLGGTTVEKVGGVWFMCDDGDFTWGNELWSPRQSKWLLA